MSQPTTTHRTYPPCETKWVRCTAHSHGACYLCGLKFAPGDAIRWRLGQAIHEYCAQLVTAAEGEPQATSQQHDPSALDNLRDGVYTVPGHGQPFYLSIYRPTDGSLKEKVVISYLVGENITNPHHYAGFGFLNENGRGYLWRRFQDTPPFTDMLKYVMTMVLQRGAEYVGPMDS